MQTRKNLITEFVKVADIAEYPTMLGNRCALLQELGLSAYQDTEEVLIDALTQTAKDPKWLDVCLDTSHCRAFWDIFNNGKTPFFDRDPIKLIEYGGQYWVTEGKHRICMAKRASVMQVEALVHHLGQDTVSVKKTPH